VTRNLRCGKGPVVTAILRSVDWSLLGELLPGFPLTWLQKDPGLSRTPEAFFQDPVVSRQCLNMETNTSWRVLELGFLNFQDLESPGKQVCSWKILEFEHRIEVGGRACFGVCVRIIASAVSIIV